jgi:hypothetical protein
LAFFAAAREIRALAEHGGADGPAVQVMPQ